MTRNPFLLNTEEQHLLPRPRCTTPRCEEFVTNGYPACSVHLGPLLLRLSKSTDRRLESGPLRIYSRLAEVVVNDLQQLDAKARVDQMSSQEVPAGSGKSTSKMIRRIDSTGTHQPSLRVSQHNFHSSPGAHLSDISKFKELQPVWRTPLLEKQRQRLVEKHDVSALERFVYRQEGASLPPLGVVVPATHQLQKRKNVLYAQINPRIHWTWHHSREWYQRKQEQIKARGGRKANFGKAGRRMKERRLNEDSKAWEESLPERVCLI